MNAIEAGLILLKAEGNFELERTERGIRVKYTGTDPEEEGRIAEAVLVVAQRGGLVMQSMKTDDEHMSGDERSAETK